jgi:hypothetical protein
MIAGATGAGIFAFSFGYIYGEVRAGSDPGLERAGHVATTTRRSPARRSPAPQRIQPQQQIDPQQVDPRQLQPQQLPPVTTQQS